MTQLKAQKKKRCQSFMANKQTTDNIQIIRNLIERKIGAGEKVFMVFIHLKAVFGSIHIRMIWKCLEGRDIPKKIIKSIKKYLPKHFW